MLGSGGMDLRFGSNLGSLVSAARMVCINGVLIAEDIFFFFEDNGIVWQNKVSKIKKIWDWVITWIRGDDFQWEDEKFTTKKMNNSGKKHSVHIFTSLIKLASCGGGQSKNFSAERSCKHLASFGWSWPVHAYLQRNLVLRNYTSIKFLNKDEQGLSLNIMRSSVDMYSTH